MMKREIPVLAIVILMAGCGSSDKNGGGTGGSGTGATSGTGGSGGGSFTPTEPIADVCGLLALSDIQSIYPLATTGTAQPNPDTSAQGFWSRACHWEENPPSTQTVQVVVGGAITQEGLTGMKYAANTGTVNTPVSGLGDEARYFEDAWPDTGETYDNGIWALQGSYSVVVGAHFFVTYPTEAQFVPLVEKALGAL